MADAEAVDERTAVRRGMWAPLLILVALVVLTPPLGLFAAALQVWSGVAEEVVDSPLWRTLLTAGPIPGHYVCAAVLYGLGALLGAAVFNT